ncbi:MAG: efflux RND transporter permease subunit [Patescibacteria group bacterium]|jgi:HAE1 family hydrophobic/amphiphilic exporter-1|nr:efflux RND transporter permease subunit [Patescibacteria group bacterium]
MNEHSTDIDLQNKKEEQIKEAEKFEKSPWVFLIRKSRLTYLVIGFLLLFGILTIGNLPRELQPEVEIPYAVIVTAYPGASPVDVEKQITEKIENQVTNLSGIKELQSTSSVGNSMVTIEFEADQDLTESIRNLKDEVRKAGNDLPKDAFDPEVIEISLSDEAVFIAVLSSDQYDISDLKRFAENLQSKLEGIPYVSEARVVGGLDKAINIEIDQNSLAQKGLSISQVINSISANNVNFPLGSIELSDLSYSLRVEGEFLTVSDISNLVIGSVNGKPVFLEDIARVEEGFSEKNSISRLSVDGGKPEESVSLQVYKKTGGDITRVAEEAKRISLAGEGVDYPEDVNLAVTTNNADFINESIETLMTNGLQTVLIVLVLLFMFLGWKEALIAGLAVPFSFFIAFIVMSLVGESLNFLSLFALVLALGLLVDSAIVVVEGMYQKVGKYRISGYQAAILTIKEYAAPLMSGMLTTIAVFSPLMFIEGIIGDFMKTIPIVVIATLIAALFVSLTIVPAIGALVIKPQKRCTDEDPELPGEKKSLWGKIKNRCSSRSREERMASKIFNKVASKYYEVLPKIIGNKKNRKIVLFSVTILFLFSIYLPISGLLKVESFTSTDAETFNINIEMPVGTLLEETNMVTKKVEQIVLEEPEVVNFVTSVGASSGMSLGSTSRENISYIKVNLTKKAEREISSVDIVSNLRKKVTNEVTEANIDFIEQESGPPGGAPIEMRVVGDDLDVLEDLAEQAKEALAQIPTVIEAETTIESSPGEFVFVPNKDILAREGLSVIQLAGQLRSGISGNSDSAITKEGDDIDILVKYDKEKISSFNDFEGILVNTPSGEKYSLSELGEVNLEPSLSKINRRDKERVVTVTAKTDGGNPTEITQKLQEDLKQVNLPDGYRFDYGGESEELQNIFMDMFLKMIIGIVLILFILATQFNSYKQVLVVLSTIPLAMIGVFICMAVARLTIDIPAFVGIVSLAGIVVNNAIILIDQINRQLEKGEELIEAISLSGRNRLRPIILTSITTIFGLLPLSITQPDWRNMGFAIIFGLAFSGVLTLVVVPTLFASFYKKKLQ